MSFAPGFFFQERDRYVPTGRGVSPWNGHSQSGIAIAGLCAHLIDGAPTPTPMHPARLTIDIMGAVPMAPLTPTLSIAREGKRLQLLNVALEAEGRVWARASVLRVRIEEVPGQAPAPTRPFPPAPHELFQSGMSETIRVDPGQATPGKGARWARFPYPVIVGEAVRPLEAAAMIADFGSGISPMLPMAEWTFANLDISIHLARLPQGEWLLVDAESETSGNGIGIARSRLSDTQGVFGTSNQTIFLDRRR